MQLLLPFPPSVLEFLQVGRTLSESGRGLNQSRECLEQLQKRMYHAVRSEWPSVLGDQIIHDLDSPYPFPLCEIEFSCSAAWRKLS